jgi:exopolyphosphatase/guanosine-5'-triphosphate,3'-diphosphate pyrophosphatase
VRVAALDVGTNSTRLLVADVEGGLVRPLERRVVVSGLGAGVDAAGRLEAAGVSRTLEVLASYAEAARSAGAARVRAVATSAVRDAADRDEFLGRAAGVLGVRLEVIDGEEEAALSFLGAAGEAAGPAPYLVVDVGGGSTEFVLGGGEPSFLRSIDLGSRRITERFLAHLPAGREALAAARRAAGEAFAGLALPGVPGTVIGTGGTYTALAAIALGLRAYDPERVHGSVLALGALDGLVERLAALSLEEVAALPSLDPARAPVLLGGAVVGAEALRRSGRRELVVSEADLLDGIARLLAG